YGDLSADEEIVFMGDASFSDTNDNDSAEEQPQAASTSISG
ncbi:hypothetical protein Tco_0553699, partial [Tanacetum coccineum]